MDNLISKLTVTDNVCLITINNLPNQVHIISDILYAIADEKINIDMINQSVLVKSDVISVSFTICDDDLTSAIKVLANFKKDYPRLSIEVNSANVKLCVYGENMPNTYGVASAVLKTLADTAIEINLITTSEVDMSILVAEQYTDDAIQAIKSAFNI